MSRTTYAVPVAVLLTCAGVCGGSDLAARRAAGPSSAPVQPAEPPSPEPRTARATSPAAAPAASTAAEAPKALEPYSPIQALGFLAETAQDAVYLYGHCRNEGTWMFTFFRAKALQTLADPTATEERRVSAQHTLDFHEGTLTAHGPIGDVFRVCGIIGPSEPPPWLAALPLSPGGPRPSPPPAGDATADDTALTEGSRSDPEIVPVEPSVPPR